MGFNKVAGDKVSASEWNSFLASAGFYGSSSAGSDAYAITITPVPNDYDLGDKYIFKADVANTGACSLNVNGLGAKTIKKLGGTEDLVTGDILASQMVTVIYDGTNFQMVSAPNVASAQPTMSVLTANTPIGDSTTQFDITNPAGSTYRYTYDGTGTDPAITALTHPIGTIVDIQAQNFSSGNNGLFVVTGSGSNYFEVTNASGVVESNKTLGTGYINKGDVWSKPSGLKYITIQVVGAGGGGGGAGGGGGTGTAGGRSVFGTIIANGGGAGQRGSASGIAGGTASGGDINSKGGTGGDINADYDSFHAVGGTSVLGNGYGGGGDGANPIAAGGGGVLAGCGGGGGGYAYSLIPASSLGTTINYVVGYRGSGGVGTGTGANTGENGGTGAIIITHYYIF